jgi:hypothetical protein
MILHVIDTNGKAIPVLVDASGNLKAIVTGEIEIKNDAGNQIPVNMSQINGQAVVTANVNGVQAMGGNIAEGAAPTAYPVRMAGWDGVNVRTMKTDAGGNVSVGTSQANGLINYRLLSAATTNATLIKTGASKLYSLRVSNMSAATKFVKLYNKATAPTVGTDVPVFTFPVAAGTVTPIELTSGNDMGVSFALGLGLAITGALADADTTAVVLNDVIINAQYM